MELLDDRLISFFAKKFRVNTEFVRGILNQPIDEFYTVGYYLYVNYPWHEISHSMIENLFLQWIEPNKKAVLDVGCGPGFYTDLCLRVAKEYIGIDSSASAIQLARKIHSAKSRVQFKVLAVQEMESLDDNSIDVIFCSEVIEHIPDLQPVVNEFHRVLKKNGKIFLTTTTFYYYLAHVLILFGYKDIVRRRDSRKFLRRIRLYLDGFNSSENRTKFMKEGLDRDDHVHAFTYAQLKKLFPKDSFTIEKYTYFNCKGLLPGKIFLPVNWILKNILRKSRIYGPNIALLLSKHCRRHKN